MSDFERTFQRGTIKFFQDDYFAVNESSLDMKPSSTELYYLHYDVHRVELQE